MSADKRGMFRDERAPEAWQAAVEAIGDVRVRAQVACIVWWDFFSQRPAADRWPHLDGMMSRWKKEQRAVVEDVRRGLVEIGYPPKVAMERLGSYV